MPMGSAISPQLAAAMPDGSGRGHLGFGLYLVRLIAEFHGGSATAMDRPGGVEVGFTIAAPTVATTAPATPPETARTRR